MQDVIQREILESDKSSQATKKIKRKIKKANKVETHLDNITLKIEEKVV